MTSEQAHEILLGFAAGMRGIRKLTGQTPTKPEAELELAIETVTGRQIPTSDAELLALTQRVVADNLANG